MPQAVNFCGPPSPSAVSRVPALTKRLDLAMCRASGVSPSSDGTDDLQQNSLLFVQFHSFHIMIFNDVSLTSHLHLWQICTTMCAIYIFPCVFSQPPTSQNEPLHPHGNIPSHFTPPAWRPSIATHQSLDSAELLGFWMWISWEIPSKWGKTKNHQRVFLQNFFQKDISTKSFLEEADDATYFVRKYMKCPDSITKITLHWSGNSYFWKSSCSWNAQIIWYFQVVYSALKAGLN